MEFQSAKLYCEVLAKGRLYRRKPLIAGIETAFKTATAAGKPVIGILAEYDALTGHSQQAGAVERKELVSGGCGHGCGHNMLGAGSLAAAFAIKKYLEDGHTGTVIFYGCPGEEGGCCQSLYGATASGEELDLLLTHSTRTMSTRSPPAPATPASRPNTSSPASLPTPPAVLSLDARRWMP